MRLLASRLSLLLLPLFTTGLVAVEPLDLSDLRLGVGFIAGAATATSATSGAQRAEFGVGDQLRLDAVVGVDLGWFGALGGVGGWRERRSGSELERTVLGGRIFAGPYIPCGPVDIQLVPWAGSGRAKLDQGAESDDGRVRAWGLDAGLTAVTHSLVIAFDVGWQQDASDHHIGSTDWSYRARGVRAGTALGWRF